MCNSIQSFCHTVSRSPRGQIAQLICEKIVYPNIGDVQELDATERDTGGFGSTGRN
jgi:dUTP pyrophosphatase